MRPEMERVCQEIGKVLVGKENVIRRVVMAMLAEGHTLLDDVPGVGKTTLALALSRVLSLRQRRIQMTPDVLPSDLVGFSMVEKETGQLVYHPGILMDTNLLLADEINRTSSKTQSALLEAMEEGQVTLDGQTHALLSPFLVIATENHIGTAGTQPLPYAQLDRFMVRLTIGYPDHEAQMHMMRDRLTSKPMDLVQPVLTLEDFSRFQQEIRSVTAAEAILDYVSRLTIASREDARVETGISPRGALFLLRLSQACAWMDGRDYVTGADVQAVFCDVCAHRLLLVPSFRMQGLKVRDVLEDLLSAVPVPDRRNSVC